MHILSAIGIFLYRPSNILDGKAEHLAGVNALLWVLISKKDRYAAGFWIYLLLGEAINSGDLDRFNWRTVLLILCLIICLCQLKNSLDGKSKAHNFIFCMLLPSGFKIIANN